MKKILGKTFLAGILLTTFASSAYSTPVEDDMDAYTHGLPYINLLAADERGYDPLDGAPPGFMPDRILSDNSDRAVGPTHKVESSEERPEAERTHSVMNV